MPYMTFTMGQNGMMRRGARMCAVDAQEVGGRLFSFLHTDTRRTEHGRNMDDTRDGQRAGRPLSQW